MEVVTRPHQREHLADDVVDPHQSPRRRTLLGDRVLGEVALRPGGFASYHLEIPEGAAATAAGTQGTLTLRLESTVWSPLRALGVPDDRELGVMLDRVRIE